MSTFTMIQKRNHEAVIFCSDKHVGLRAIIALHDTTLGPALGGCRIKQYESEEAALTDVLRLSRAMTYKASISGLNLGGGKSVIMLEPGQEKTPELLAAFAKRVAMLKGTYITAGDVGSNTADLKLMRDITPHVVGLSAEDGGLGDSAILTSLGVFQGLRAAVKHRLGREDLSGLRVAVQGAGKVGYMLTGRLLDAGCDVVIADPNAESVQRLTDAYPAVQVVEGDEIYTQDVDVFSPNAIGGLITEDIAKNLKATVLAGGANNPLASEQVAPLLQQRQILYAPDFLINAGGLMMVASEIEHHTFEQAEKHVAALYEKTLNVFEYADIHQLLPWEAARQIAVNRILETRKNPLSGQARSMFAEADEQDQLEPSL